MAYIPNIIHFVFGMKPQFDEFLFAHYVNVLSAKIVNNPDKIYFHTHHEPYGYWWNKTKELVEVLPIEVPQRVGSKPIKNYANAADVARLEVLQRWGGIYLDIDVICVKPLAPLCDGNRFVMGLESSIGCGNAVILSEPDAAFIRLWQAEYEKHFNPDGWTEACITLPFLLSRKCPQEWITCVAEQCFYIPGFGDVNSIFLGSTPLSPESYCIHLWENAGVDYLRRVSPEWIFNSDSLYARVARRHLHPNDAYHGIWVVPVNQQLRIDRDSAVFECGKYRESFPFRKNEMGDYVSLSQRERQPIVGKMQGDLIRWSNGTYWARHRHTSLWMFSTWHAPFYCLPDEEYIGPVLRSGAQWDSVLIELMLPHLQHARVILDVGAHIGCHSVRYALAAPGAVVHSFEMQRSLYQLLLHNIELNNCGNIIPHHCAVGHLPGHVTTIGDRFVDGASAGCGVSYNSGRMMNYAGLQLGCGTEKVGMVTIDSLRLPFLDYMKVDVEGAEKMVFYGARETIAAYRPIIVYECRPDKIVTDQMRAVIPISSEVDEFEIHRFLFSELNYKREEVIGFDPIAFPDG